MIYFPTYFVTLIGQRSIVVLSLSKKVKTGIESGEKQC